GADSNGRVPPYVVADVLRHIGARPGAGQIWVSADGHWQNGMIAGRWSKPAAEYIGPAARDMRRRRRILELDAAIGERQTCLNAVSICIDDLNRRDANARREAGLAPIEAGVRAACDRAVGLACEAEGLRSRLAELQDQVAQKQALLEKAVEHRERTAQ